VLGGGIVLLGASLVTGEYFKAERPETMGYPIAGVEEEGEDGAEAEPPIAALLQTADAAAGEAQFRKCTSCHTANQGGANGTGPNLHGVMGAPLGRVAGFNYSEQLRAKGGTWTWEAMNEWIRSPRAYIPGTRMAFAGIADPQDRANLLAWLNTQGSNLPLPPPPAAAPAEGGGENAAAPAEQPDANAATPVGPGAPEASGRAEQEANQQ
jgi:cytochrome c